MRVALVHSFYSSNQPSGENAVVHAEHDALSRAGLDVRLIATSTDERKKESAYVVRAALRVATGRGANPVATIREAGADVVHVHNIFPNWGDVWVRELSPPLVHTVHNYRPLCSAGTFYRDGGVCTLCIGGDTRHAVRYRCYRNSAVATLPLAVHNHGGVERNPLLQQANRVVVLAPRMADVFRTAGVAGDKLRVWPNFLPDGLDPGPSSCTRFSRYLFVGRLTEEKGIEQLVRHWPEEAPALDVIGDGPSMPAVTDAAAARLNVVVHGRRDRDTVLEAMASATALIIPSRWFEGFPVIYAEALANALPVLTFEPCNVVDMVRSDETGAVLDWASPLGPQLPSDAELDSWRERCRDVFEEKYSEAAYVRRAVALYEDLADA